MVTPERKPRDSYHFLQEEFSPAVITVKSYKDQKLVLHVKARWDFPSYTLAGYQLKAGGKIVALKTLNPGESQELSIALNGSEKAGYIELIKPGGFILMKQAIK
ncbi:hypothetical protein D3C87_1727420 [compost metagenome]